MLQAYKSILENLALSCEYKLFLKILKAWELYACDFFTLKGLKVIFIKINRGLLINLIVNFILKMLIILHVRCIILL